MTIEESERLVNVLRRGQPHPVGDAAQARDAHCRADPIEHEGSKDRANGGPGYGGQEVDLPARGRKTGEGENDFRGDRREDILKEDGDTYPGRAQGVHQADYPVDDSVQVISFCCEEAGW